MTFEGLWLLSLWTFHWWGNCNQGLLCDSSLWVSFRSCSPRRSWACPATSARWPSAVCQTKVYWLGNFTRHVRSETEQETSIEICSYSFMSGVSGMPGVSLFMFSPKLLLEPIEDLIVLELMVVQDIFANCLLWILKVQRARLMMTRSAKGFALPSIWMRTSMLPSTMLRVRRPAPRAELCTVMNLMCIEKFSQLRDMLTASAPYITAFSVLGAGCAASVTSFLSLALTVFYW